jgi:hypothetical protein
VFDGHATHTSLSAPVMVEYFPARQSVHAPEPVTVLYFPATQAVHVLPKKPALHWQEELPATEFVFDGHATHTSLTAPVLAEYLPVRQSVHAPAPVPVLYLPATQAVHGLPVKPASHWHSELLELPAGEFEFAGHATHTSLTAPVLVEYLPARQSVHASEPVPVLYLPATQAVHAPPVKPALHWHCELLELPAGESEFDGHATHTSLTAPVLVEYLPARQSVHASEPVPVLYLPATQAVHGLPVKPALH